MRVIHAWRGRAARFAVEHFQAKWHTWRLGKCDRERSIFKPSGTLGDSENATKKAHALLRRGMANVQAPANWVPEYFQAKWNTWRLGKYDQTKAQ
jgi:hypothetical protein